MLFEVPQFDKEDTRNQYSPLEWELIDINKVDFTNKKPTEGLWHLLLLRKFSLKGLTPQKIHFDESILTDLYTQPPCVVPAQCIDDKNYLNEKYILEDNLKIAEDERKLWDLLRMKISLYLPTVEIDENDKDSEEVSYFLSKLKYVNYT